MKTDELVEKVEKLEEALRAISNMPDIDGALDDSGYQRRAKHDLQSIARAALEATISAAPPSDDYRRGLEDAARVIRNWSLPTVQTPSMWLIDKAGIEADILALGGLK